MAERFLMTHSLLSSWLYCLKENPYEDATSESDPLGDFLKVLRREPTETTEGEKVYRCTICGETKTATIPVIGHIHHYESKVTAPTCTEQGYTTHTCSCGDSYVDTYVDALGHALGAWTVIKQATCTAKGEEQRSDIKQKLGDMKKRVDETIAMCNENCRCGESVNVTVEE